MDNILAQTSRMLSLLSHSAGFALSPRLEGQVIKRIELVPIAPNHCLAVLITKSGVVRHWPVSLEVELPVRSIPIINRFLNESLAGRTVREVQAGLPTASRPPSGSSTATPRASGASCRSSTGIAACRRSCTWRGWPTSSRPNWWTWASSGA